MRKAINPPAYCAGCYQQRPDEDHVDFEAYYDGPVIDQANGIKMPVDDLVLCRTCLSSAARHIGMVDGEELKAENEELGELVEKLQADIAKKDKIIRDQNATNNQLLDVKVAKRAGRPKTSIQKQAPSIQAT